MGKKWLLCAAMLALAGSLFATGTAEVTGKVTMVGTDTVVAAKDFGYSPKPKKEYTIAVVVKSAAIPVWESHLIAAEKAGKKLGVKILGYAPTKADNVEEQKRILEDLITTGVDAVVLAPANTEAVRGPVLDLIKAGIPVIYDNTMGPSNVDYLTYVGVDNMEVGNVIAKTIGEMMGGKGKLLVLEGVPGQSTSDLRTEGVMKSIAKNYPGHRRREGGHQVAVRRGPEGHRGLHHQMGQGPQGHRGRGRKPG